MSKEVFVKLLCSAINDYARHVDAQCPIADAESVKFFQPEFIGKAILWILGLPVKGG